MEFLIDLFLHFDRHLAEFATSYGVLVYALLFAIVFAETGLVVTPILPGDSLLFAAGALAATGALDIWLVLVLLLSAAVLGDAANYSVGRYVGPRVFSAHDGQTFWHRILNHDHLDKAHAFFEKYGGKAVVLARFVPIVRTFAPFVAGIGSMTYPRFLAYNVIGGTAWVLLFLLAGYFFGQLPFVKENFELVVPAIVLLSLVPIIYEMVKSRWGRDDVASEA